MPRLRSQVFRPARHFDNGFAQVRNVNGAARFSIIFYLKKRFSMVQSYRLVKKNHK